MNATSKLDDACRLESFLNPATHEYVSPAKIMQDSVDRFYRLLTQLDYRLAKFDGVGDLLCDLNDRLDEIENALKHAGFLIVKPVLNSPKGEGEKTCHTTQKN